MPPALFSCAMNTLHEFFGSLAEPARLALMGASLMIGALLLRKLLLPVHSTLDSASKADTRQGTNAA